MKVFVGIVLFAAFVGGLVAVARGFGGVGFGGGGGQANEGSSSSSSKPQARAPAPPPVERKPVALPELFVVRDGKQLALAGARKQPMLLHLWASWCGPCVQELPSLLAFGRKGKVDVVAVSVDDYWEPVAKFFRGAVPAEVAWDQKITLERELGVDSIPTTFLVDTRGFVVDRFDGAMDWTNPDLARVIDDDLKPAK